MTGAAQTPQNIREALLIEAILKIDGFEEMSKAHLFRMLSHDVEHENFRQQWNATFDLTNPDIDPTIEIEDVAEAAPKAFELRFSKTPIETMLSPPVIQAIEVSLPPAGPEFVVETVTSSAAPVEAARKPRRRKQGGDIAQEAKAQPIVGTIPTDTPVEEAVIPATRPSRHRTAPREDVEKPPKQRVIEEDPQVVIGQKTLLQEAAITTARTNFAVMKNYDSEEAQKIADTLFMALLAHAPAAIANAPNKPVALQNATMDRHGNTGIGRSTFTHCIKDGTAPSNNTSVGGIDRLVSALCLNPEHHDEVANYLMGIPWPARTRSGDALMQYAKEHLLSCDDVMRLARFQRRLNQRDHAAKLDINYNKYCSIIYPSVGATPRRETLDAVAQKLGCTEGKSAGEKNVTLFRQLALGIDPVVAEAALHNAAFTDNDTSRPEQVTAFLDVLRKAHGLHDNKELAEAIAATHPCDVAQLQRACNDMSSRQHDKERSSTVRRYRHTMSENFAGAIASFAYPDMPDKQKACAAFLASPGKWSVRQQDDPDGPSSGAIRK